MEHGGYSWPEDPDVLHLAHRADRCMVLGPGVRAVIWVQGCKLRCPDCISPHSLPFRGGISANVKTLARELSALPVDGITVSGGEPFEQAAALCRLIRLTRAHKNMSFLCYTGYLLNDLQTRGTSAQRALLSELDLLIDGPYIEQLHGKDLWRGSSNQKIHFLSRRYSESILRSKGNMPMFELTISAEGSIFWMGIPPRGFATTLMTNLAAYGITFIRSGGFDE